MKQEILYREAAREVLLSGVNKLADVVASTLGPSGHNVILNLESGIPVATKDGVTVAKSIKLDCPLENTGAQMLKQASIKTAEEAGDGTTTATVLAREIFVEASKLGSKYNTVEVRKGMEGAVSSIVSYIKNNISIPVKVLEDLKKIATISANGDSEIGVLVSKALDKVGLDGAVTLEESKTGETYLDVVEGIQFDRGYKSPYFVTDNDTMTAVLEDVLILICNNRLTTVKDMLPVLNAVAQSTKSLLIIAEDIDGELLSTLVLNKVRAGLKVCAVKAPEFGDRRKETLEDIAILTGGTVISTEKGMNIEKFNSEWLGEAKKVTVNRDKTTIIGAKGSQEAVDARITNIVNQIDKTQSPYDKEQLQARLARLAGGVAVMYVGGHTELEMKERKDRVDDALHATRAALEEGICPGGGRALVAAARALQTQENKEEMTEDYKAGWNIVVEACYKPFKQILENAGVGNVESWKNAVIGMENVWESYIPDQGRVHMAEVGVVDPTKVIRLALKNAVSVAGTMITSEAVVVNISEPEDKSTVPGMY